MRNSIQKFVEKEYYKKLEKMSSHEQERMMEGLGGDGFVSELEEEVKKEERREVRVPVEFEDLNIVPGGAQVPGAVEKVAYYYYYYCSGK